MNEIISTKDFRECFMIATSASQGGGKSYQNKLLICKYVKDKLAEKVKGRKCLILDTNGEYGTETFGKDGLPPLEVRRIAVRDVKSWCRSNVAEARRIDMKDLSIDEKLQILDYVCQNARTTLLILEDINTVILDVTHMKNIVSSIVNLRHKGVDVIISYQSVRAIEPRVLSNSRYLRLHFVSEDIDNVKGKLGEPEIYKIAQLIINQKYFTGDKRFFLYICNNPHKLEGNFSKNDFLEAAKKYLRINKKRLRDEMEITGCNVETAVNNQAAQMVNLYYGNKDKDKK